MIIHSFSADDSLEDLEEFWFGDFTVVVLVDGGDELVDFLS